MAGFFERLKSGLSRTAEAVANLLARPMDAASAEQLRERLIAADFGPVTADEVVEAARAAWKTEASLRKTSPAEAAAESIVRALGGETAAAPALTKPHVIMLLGVNGAGKTTTAAKLAWRWKQEGRTCLLGACDTFRAAAVEQLQVWGERNAVQVVAQDTGSDSASVIFDAYQSAKAKGMDILIADTAGRLHTKDNLMTELEKIVRVLKKQDPRLPDEILLVLDSTTGQNALAQADSFHKSTTLTGLALTKLDGSAKGGVAFALAKRLGIPLRFIGVGEQIDDLRPFNAHDFVAALFGDEENRDS